MPAVRHQLNQELLNLGMYVHTLFYCYLLLHESPNDLSQYLLVLRPLLLGTLKAPCS